MDVWVVSGFRSEIWVQSGEKGLVMFMRPSLSVSRRIMACARGTFSRTLATLRVRRTCIDLSGLECARALL